MVVDSLVQFMKECNNEHGFSIIAKEPSASTYADVDKPATCKERADIVLVNNSISAMIDVAVVNPSSDGRSHTAGIYNTPMVSMKQIYDKKVAVHGGAARCNSLKMVPFILEAYGSMHSDAQSLIDSIARSADYTASNVEVQDQALRGHALISIALQNGNGMIAECGINTAKPYTSGLGNSRLHSADYTSAAALLPFKYYPGHDGTSYISDPNYASSLCINKALSSFVSAGAAASSAALTGLSVSSFPPSSFASVAYSNSKSSALRLLNSAFLDSQINIAPAACSYVAAAAGLSTSACVL
jgi:hypothetical protein